jgi:2',3'-cyclic-nucleotide 2'-phosphodiesterase/3'-nucleotidase
VDDQGLFSARSQLLPAGDRTPEAFSEVLREAVKSLSAFLDTPLGHLDTPLPAAEPLARALHGSLIANFFNQVQLDASGAELSATCLSNTVPGFSENVTLRDIVSNYEFPNTLKILRVDRGILKQALERSAAYFTLDENGAPQVSREFLTPIVQHFNFDYLSGIEATVDLRRPVGERVTSMLWHGDELPEDQSLSLCLNSYRASGAGSYAFYADCETIGELPDEISALIIQYVDRKRDIAVDRRQWLHVIY